MKTSKLNALFLTGFLSLCPGLCLAGSQPSNDESGLVAITSAEDANPAGPQELHASEGGADAGGGNFHGTELFDDYENQGSDTIPVAELRALVEPYLAGLRKNIPALAAALEEGLQKKWYLEPKALRQDGNCRNQSVLSVRLEVRACQSPLAVRVDKAFFAANPAVRAPLVMHELLVSLQLFKGRERVSDEAVRELSRLLRAPSPDYAEIRNMAQVSGAGLYLMAAEREEYLAIMRAFEKSQCTITRAGNEVGSKMLDKREDFFNRFSALPPLHETDALEARVKAELRSVKCNNPFYRR